MICEGFDERAQLRGPPKIHWPSPKMQACFSRFVHLLTGKSPGLPRSVHRTTIGRNLRGEGEMARYRFGRSGVLAMPLFMAMAGSTVSRGAETPPPPGAELYAQLCASCHDHPKDRIPSRETLAKRTPEEVVMALTSGSMRVQAGGLNLNQQNALATFITGRAPSEASARAPEKNLCKPGVAAAAAAASRNQEQWNGWGRDLENSRFQPKPGLTAADLPRLKLQWAFGYRGSSIYGQPTVVEGKVYVTSVTGRVYALDAATGCTHWTYDAKGPSRTAVTVSHVTGAPGAGASQQVVFVGDDTATVYALKASDGSVVWQQRLDEHAAARISGAPVFHDQRLYVPVSSLEELSAVTPGYECCTFRGSVAALEAGTGRVLWQTYTIDKVAQPTRKARDGTQLRGPAGVAVWSAPTIDPARNQLYVGTGNSYTDETAPRANAILAMNLATGRIVWENQVAAADNYIVGCDIAPSGPCEVGKACPAGPPNCPNPVGPDIDFGTSPILRTLADGRQILITGQKSGELHALDPKDGREVWSSRVGAGSAIGGIEWGHAADDTQVYAAVSDLMAPAGHPRGGISALRIADGKQVWRTPAPQPVCSWGSRGCSAAQSQAVTVIPGAVFSGSHDGHLRAYSSTDGRILWDVDTGLPFETVNAVPAAGGSLDHGGATVAGGRVFVNSGYGRINGQPGNVLLVYGVSK
jgi:polyvinyl alcohol dehydrogenase (cytochrome)